MMIPFSPPRIDQKVIDEVVDTLKSGWITTGPKTKEFERRLTAYCGNKATLAVNSNTVGLEVVLRWFGVQEGDEVILSVMEHHSNIVPWQLLAAKRGITIKVIPMNDKGELLLDEYRQLFSERTRIVSVAHVSNVLGTVNPV